MKLLANYNGYATFQVTDAEYDAMRWLGLQLTQAAYENNRTKIAARVASVASAPASLPAMSVAKPAVLGTPILATLPDPYALPDFGTLGPPLPSSCPGCSQESAQPQSYEQVYKISAPAKAAASSAPGPFGTGSLAGGLVDVTVDTSPLLVLGVLWFLLRKK